MKQLMDTAESLHLSAEEHARRFCHLAEELGFIASEQTETLLLEAKQQWDRGADTSVGQLMLSRGYLTEDQMQEILLLLEEIYKKDYPAPAVEEHGKRPCVPTPSGRYRVVREIARGGTAVVYEAVDPDLNRTVALKVLKQEEADSILVERLRREASVVAGLRHPHIVSVHEIGHHTDEHGRETYFIVMDYIKGQTLDERMPQMMLWERIRVLEVVAQTIGYAHMHGVVHRDLKPKNILLEEASGETPDLKWHVYVTDFGLAKTEGSSDLTRTGMVVGTAYYMAPEQARGQTRNTGPRTDVWALGVMLYEMITDVKPFTGDTALEVYDRISKQDPLPPRRLKPDLPPSLETICLKAMTKDPSQRYPDALALAQDIKAFRTHDAIQARPADFTTRIVRWVRCHAVASGFLLGATVLMLLAGALMITHEDSDTPSFIIGLLIGSAALTLAAFATLWISRLKRRREQSSGLSARQRVTKQEYVQRKATRLLKHLKSQDAPRTPPKNPL